MHTRTHAHTHILTHVRMQIMQHAIYDKFCIDML